MTGRTLSHLQQVGDDYQLKNIKIAEDVASAVKETVVTFHAELKKPIKEDGYHPKSSTAVKLVYFGKRCPIEGIFITTVQACTRVQTLEETGSAWQRFRACNQAKCGVPSQESSHLQE